MRNIVVERRQFLVDEDERWKRKAERTTLLFMKIERCVEKKKKEKRKTQQKYSRVDTYDFCV
jgi:hypothetical protein